MEIEEAWKAFCRTPVLEYTGLVNGKSAEETKEKARALCLAVLAESTTGWSEDVVTHLRRVAECHDALRARIERLGE